MLLNLSREQPLIFVLKSGVDPLYQLNKLSDSLGIQNDIRVCVSLFQK